MQNAKRRAERAEVRRWRPTISLHLFLHFEF
jgi:hypothetical protein